MPEAQEYVLKHAQTHTHRHSITHTNSRLLPSMVGAICLAWISVESQVLPPLADFNNFLFYFLLFLIIHALLWCLWNFGYIITQGSWVIYEPNLSSFSIFKGFFYFMGNVCFKTWSDWSGQHNNWITACCIMGNFWDTIFLFLFASS